MALVSFSRLHLDTPFRVYQTEFPIWQEHEDWNTIIQRGSSLIEDTKETKDIAKARVCCQVAEALLFKGRVQEASLYLEMGEREIKEVPSRGLGDLPLDLLYLKSKALRMQGAFQEAIACANQGIDQAEGLMKGKFFYQLAAAHSEDPQGNLNHAFLYNGLAHSCLREDAPLLRRLRLRSVRICLKTESLQDASKDLDALDKRVGNQRFKMHRDFLEAQLCEALKKNLAAESLARNALTRARMLGAEADEKRCLAFLENLLQPKS